MTEPPYDTGPGAPPPGFGPPGFGPSGQTPWQNGRPLAAAHSVSHKRFLAVMAFFGALLLASVAGFVLTRPDQSEQAVVPAEEFGGTIGPPRETVLKEPPAPRPVPKPVVYRGSGTKVVKIRRPEPGDALLYVKAAPAAGRLLSIAGVDAKGVRNGLVVTSLERYEGVRVLDVTSLARTAALEIEAGGPWVVEIRSVRSAKAFRGSITGTGDAVLRYTGGAGTATIRGGAPMKPFTVLTRTGQFPRLVVTAVGTFDGEKVWPKGPVLVEIQASGRWSIRVT